MPDTYKALKKAVVVCSWFSEKETVILKGSVLTMDVSAAGQREWNLRFFIIALLIELCPLNAGFTGAVGVFWGFLFLFFVKQIPLSFSFYNELHCLFLPFLLLRNEAM